MRLRNANYIAVLFVVAHKKCRRYEIGNFEYDHGMANAHFLMRTDKYAEIFSSYLRITNGMHALTDAYACTKESRIFSY